MLHVFWTASASGSDTDVIEDKHRLSQDEAALRTDLQVFVRF